MIWTKKRAQQLSDQRWVDLKGGGLQTGLQVYELFDELLSEYREIDDAEKPECRQEFLRCMVGSAEGVRRKIGFGKFRYTFLRTR